MRNVRCPQYSRCLDDAIRQEQAGFTCLGCSHRYDEDRIDTTELIGCLMLLWRVFIPDRYHAAIDEQVRHK